MEMSVAQVAAENVDSGWTKRRSITDGTRDRRSASGTLPLHAFD